MTPRLQQRRSVPFQATAPCRRMASSLSDAHARIHDLRSNLIAANSTITNTNSTAIPSEQRVLYVLEQLDALASTLLEADTSKGSPSSPPSPSAATTATSALLGSVNTPPATSAIPTKPSLLADISRTVEAMLRDPTVFITPALLRAYVDLQARLHQPSSFPEIFHLYAHKLIPTPSKDGTITYAPATPQKISSAIDSTTANRALAAATSARDLELAIDVIETSFRAPAFARAKLLRRALVPTIGLAGAPLIAWTLSTQFSLYQTTMPASTATGIAMAGILTYMTSISTIGYVVVTTSNDQMDRVTWAPGVPLWERWTREEERAAVDRVAGCWGFEGGKRGDEEGAEWEGLREWIGRRGMILDKVALMEGME